MIKLANQDTQFLNMCGVIIAVSSFLNIFCIVLLVNYLSIRNQ